MIQDDVHLVARRHALGAALQVWRTHKGLSKAGAAETAGLAPMTWTRLEAGAPVRNGSYGILEQGLHLHVGTVIQALADDVSLVDLARQLGVDVHAVDDGQPASEWVSRFARVAAPPVPGDGLSVVTVAEIVARLARDPKQSPAKQRAVAALLQVLPELAP